jgi:radical SAM protein with 4Fe4S-binding SPASM domain
VVRRRLELADDHRPAYVVWELTLACDQPCTHCGSRAGDARERELSTRDALRVVGDLAAMRAEEIALIGGEAYLHDGFLDIVRAIVSAGMRCTMTTGGRGVDAARAREMAAAGLHSVSVSVDGIEPTHDLMRAARGSFAAATGALRHLATAGVPITANTNFNRLNLPEVEALYDALKAVGVESWQVQITAPLGRAADRADLILQPWDLLDLLPRIAAVKRRAFADGILVMPGNNLGYFGPEEGLLRSVTPEGADHFQGCLAGRWLMGIESSGDVKGCPSLQSASYVGGNVRARPLAEIWRDAPEVGFTRARTVDDLWGFCRTCPFAEVCMGGCSFTAHSVLGRPGNNPYCHHRARTLARDGKRERLVPVRRAPGTPFDSALFEIVIEPIDAPDPSPRRPLELVQLRRPAAPIK